MCHCTRQRLLSRSFYKISSNKRSTFSSEKFKLGLSIHITWILWLMDQFWCLRAQFNFLVLKKIYVQLHAHVSIFFKVNQIFYSKSVNLNFIILVSTTSACVSSRWQGNISNTSIMQLNCFLFSSIFCTSVNITFFKSLQCPFQTYSFDVVDIHFCSFSK